MNIAVITPRSTMKRTPAIIASPSRTSCEPVDDLSRGRVGRGSSSTAYVDRSSAWISSAGTRGPFFPRACRVHSGRRSRLPITTVGVDHGTPFEAAHAHETEPRRVGELRASPAGVLDHRAPHGDRPRSRRPRPRRPCAAPSDFTESAA